MHDEARRGHLSHEGVDVATYAWGDPDAPAVLLVHGWQSRASAFGSLVSALTGAGLRVVAYDAPAHGDSGGHTRTALDDLAIVRRLTDVEAEPWAGVVGHSLGSLAAGVAVREGVPTQRLAGIASIASFRFTEDVFVRAIGLPWSLRDRFSRAWAHRLRDNPEVTPDVADRFDLVMHPLPKHVRMLWLHDDGDRQIPQTQSELLLGAHSHSGELVTTTGLGHNRILGDTAATPMWSATSRPSWKRHAGSRSNAMTRLQTASGVGNSAQRVTVLPEVSRTRRTRQATSLPRSDGVDGGLDQVGLDGGVLDGAAVRRLVAHALPWEYASPPVGVRGDRRPPSSWWTPTTHRRSRVPTSRFHSCRAALCGSDVIQH